MQNWSRTAFLGLGGAYTTALYPGGGALSRCGWAAITLKTRPTQRWIFRRSPTSLYYKDPSIVVKTSPTPVAKVGEYRRQGLGTNTLHPMPLTPFQVIFPYRFSPFFLLRRTLPIYRFSVFPFTTPPPLSALTICAQHKRFDCGHIKPETDS